MWMLTLSLRTSEAKGFSVHVLSKNFLFAHPRWISIGEHNTTAHRTVPLEGANKLQTQSNVATSAMLREIDADSSQLVVRANDDTDPVSADCRFSSCAFL
jgi:hypothetical protein